MADLGADIHLSVMANGSANYTLLSTAQACALLPGNITNCSFSNSGNDQTLYELQQFQFYAWGVVGNIISALGVFGNIFNIIVLTDKHMRSSTSCYLIALAIFDSAVLISMTLFLALPAIHLATEQLKSYYEAYPHMHPFAYPLALIAQTCTIYITVAFTIERYIAVCWPLHAAKMCTISRARKVILLIFVMSVLYNIPRMLETRVVLKVNQDNSTYSDYEDTEFGQNKTYRHVYHMYLYIFVMLLIPFVILAVLNALLIRAVQMSQRTQGKINKKVSKENNLTIMLIAVVVVFLLCQMLAIADNIIQAFATKREDLHAPVFVKITCVSNVMVITNSAINFYLYCVFGRKFRKVFCMLFCRWYYKDTRRSAERDTSMMLASSVRRSNRSQHHMSVYENGHTRNYHTSNGQNARYTKMYENSL